MEKNKKTNTRRLKRHNLDLGWKFFLGLPFMLSAVLAGVKIAAWHTLGWWWVLSPVLLALLGALSFTAFFYVMLWSTARYKSKPMCRMCVHCIEKPDGTKAYCARRTPIKAVDPDRDTCDDFFGSVTKGWEGSLRKSTARPESENSEGE